MNLHLPDLKSNSKPLRHPSVAAVVPNDLSESAVDFCPGICPVSSAAWPWDYFHGFAEISWWATSDTDFLQVNTTVTTEKSNADMEDSLHQFWFYHKTRSHYFGSFGHSEACSGCGQSHRASAGLRRPSGAHLPLPLEEARRGPADLIRS